MRISDWSSDVCSSDLVAAPPRIGRERGRIAEHVAGIADRAGGLGRTADIDRVIGPVEEFEEHLVLAAAIGLGTAGLNVEPPIIIVPFVLYVPGLRIHRGSALWRVDHRQGSREAGPGDVALLP